MSKDNVKKLFGKMEKDAELLKKYSSLMQEHQKEAEKTLSDKLIEFGKTSGFAFSKDDLLAARAEFIDKINENKELADNDLGNVAGGGSGCVKQHTIVLSILTWGGYCAFVSIYKAADKTGCTVALSLDGREGCTKAG